MQQSKLRGLGEKEGGGSEFQSQRGRINRRDGGCS